jgi:hypothetical protein
MILRTLKVNGGLNSFLHEYVKGIFVHEDGKRFTVSFMRTVKGSRFFHEDGKKFTFLS